MIDFILHIDVHLGALISQYGTLTYLIVFGIIFAETGFVLTPLIPGDSLLFAAGAFAALGSLNVVTLLIVLFAAAVLGDNVNYSIGYHLGQSIIRSKSIPINQKHLDRTTEFYAKYGNKTIVLARFMPVVRTFAPFVAGIGKMNYRNFVFYNIIGGFMWVFLFILGGYFFGNIPIIKDHFSLVVMAIILVSIIPIIYEIVKSRRSKKSEGHS